MVIRFVVFEKAAACVDVALRFMSCRNHCGLRVGAAIEIYFIVGIAAACIAAAGSLGLRTDCTQYSLQSSAAKMSAI